jgi:putative addiction module antidote
MIQKIIKVGTSMAVVLPKPFRVSLGWGEKDSVRITERDGGIFIEPVKKTEPVHDAKLLAWTDSFIEEYKDALVELKDR